MLMEKESEGPEEDVFYTLLQTEIFTVADKLKALAGTPGVKTSD